MLFACSLRRRQVTGDNVLGNTIHHPGYFRFSKAATFLISLLFILITNAQETCHNYNVLKNGTVIGYLKFSETRKGSSTRLKMESVVETRFIFLINIYMLEETNFENGILTFSSIYRKVNNKEKENIKTILQGTAYQVADQGRIIPVKSYPIKFNLLNLYRSEPINIASVYCERFQQFVPVLKVESNKYKVTMPDGNSNTFYYKDNICTRVEVVHSFYSIVIVLKKPV